MICTGCNLKNDHADANQSDGMYVCFDCRRNAEAKPKTFAVEEAIVKAAQDKAKAREEWITNPGDSIVIDGVKRTFQMRCKVVIEAM